jgi:hypothetical protein
VSSFWTEGKDFEKFTKEGFIEPKRKGRTHKFNSKCQAIFQIQKSESENMFKYTNRRRFDVIIMLDSKIGEKKTITSEKRLNGYQIMLPEESEKFWVLDEQNLKGLSEKVDLMRNEIIDFCNKFTYRSFD